MVVTSPAQGERGAAGKILCLADDFVDLISHASQVALIYVGKDIESGLNVVVRNINRRNVSPSGWRD